jgi:hypothetical protein
MSKTRGNTRGTSAGALGYTWLMETENLQYKIVMNDGPDAEVLGRLAHLELASAAYHAAIVKYPLRNIQLRQGAQIIKRHDGEPRPEPPRDPNLKSWSAHLIGGKKCSISATSRRLARRRRSRPRSRCLDSTTSGASG